jgi:hypothetical protein
MTGAVTFSKRLAKAAQDIALRTKAPKTVRHAIVDEGEELPQEVEGELLITRQMVKPPESTRKNRFRRRKPRSRRQSSFGSKKTRIEPYTGPIRYPNIGVV